MFCAKQVTKKRNGFPTLPPTLSPLGVFGFLYFAVAYNEGHATVLESLYGMMLECYHHKDYLVVNS